MIQFDIEKANGILSHPDVSKWFEGAFDLQQVLHLLINDTLVAIVHPITSVAWMVHIAAKPGTSGHKTVRAVEELDDWLDENIPTGNSVLAYIDPENERCWKIAEAFGFQRTGYLHGFYMRESTYHDILIYERRVK